MTSYNDNFRDKYVKLLEKYIPHPHSRNIEKGIYNYTIDVAEKNDIICSWDVIIFKNLYLSKIRSIYSNIKSDSYIQNKDFLKNIVEGKYDNSKIAYMSVYDIFPDVWKELFDTKAARDKKI